MTRNLHPLTLALHRGGRRADPANGAVAVPIFATTSYQFEDTDHASRLFALEEDGGSHPEGCQLRPGRLRTEKRVEGGRR